MSYYVNKRPSVKQEKRLSNALIVLGALAVFTLIVVCIRAIPAVADPESEERKYGDKTFAALQDEGAPVRYDQLSIRSTKLAGATEEVDEYGIVRGTTPAGDSYVLYGRDQAGASSDTITFAAVGDVFATSMNFPILDGYAGEMGDDEYDFAPYYRAVSGEIGAIDLSFINQETPCAGNEDGHAYAGYPVFNTPDSSIHALADVGFDIANFNSNHSWDQGEYGIARTQGLFAKHEQVMLVGSYASDADREAAYLVERNGATIAMLSYSYGDNMYGSNPSNFPNQHDTCQFDKERMAAEIERAKRVADAVVVYMHWGTEYDTQPDEQQVEYAQFLADLDVDLVIGSHAHILQPVKYYTSISGKRVPVVFGLSDFITGWTITDTIFSGMFSCDFTWRDGQLVVENCLFTPSIEWSDGDDVYVRFLKDMTDEEIDANTRTPDVENDSTYLRAFLDDLKMDVPIAW